MINTNAFTSELSPDIVIEIYKLDSGKFIRQASVSEFQQLRWGVVMNNASSAIFRVSIWSPDMREEFLRRFINQVAIKVNGVIVWFGPIVYTSGNLDDVGGYIDVRCLSYFYHLRSRFTDRVQIFRDIEQSQILATLVADTQTKLLDNSLNGAWLGITIGNTPLGIKRDRTYEFQSIADAIKNMSDDIGGLDFDFTPITTAEGVIDTIQFNQYNAIGQRRENYKITQDNIVSWRKTTKGDITNSVTAIGSGTGDDMPTERFTDSNLANVFTRREAILSEKDVLLAGTLIDKATAKVQTEGVEQWEGFCVLSPNCTPAYDEIGIGDLVQIEIDATSNRMRQYTTIFSTIIPDYMHFAGWGQVVEIQYDCDDNGVIYTSITWKLL